MLNYKQLHDKVKTSEVNAIFYLLRNYGALTEKIGLILDKEVAGEYGSYLYDLTNGKLIITSVEPDSNYAIVFTILNRITGVFRKVTVDNNVTDGVVSFDLPTLSEEEGLSTVIDVTVSYPRLVESISVPVYDLGLFCSTPIIQKNDTAIVYAGLTRDNVPVSGESLDYVVKHGDSVLDSGSVVTGSDGTASVSYVGTGVGDIEVIVSYGTLLQKTYSICDAIYYDSMISDTTSDYTYYPSSGSLLAFDNDGLLFTGGTSKRYFQLNYSQVQNLIGKTVRFEVYGVPSNQFRVGIFPHNPSGYINNVSAYTSESGVNYLDYSFDDDTIDSCIFRVYVNATNSTVKVNDFKIYPI